MPVVNTNIAETINITTNGSYDVSRYTNANVTTREAPAHYVEKTTQTLNGLVTLTNINTETVIDLTGIDAIGQYGLQNAYSCSINNNSGPIGAVDFSPISAVSGAYAMQQTFSRCGRITSVNMSNLETVSGNYSMDRAFAECKSLTSVDFSKLKSIGSSFFGDNCWYRTFWSCSSLTSISFPMLSSVLGANAMSNAFESCTSLRNIYFYALKSSSFGSTKTQFVDIVKGTSSCTIHFPSNMEPTIATLTGYPSFGGGNTTLVYDLPATE